MKNFSRTGTDCWLLRTEKIEKILGIPTFQGHFRKEKVKFKLKHILHSIFDRYWKDKLSEIKTGDDGINHNKLRFYSTIKSSFTSEPYLDLAHSRNQHCWITRIQTSSHFLEINTGRFTVPSTPISERLCNICLLEVGDERHFFMSCPAISIKRNCFFGKMSSIIPHFNYLSEEDKLKTILCPTSVAAVKTTNKYIAILMLARDKILEGYNISELSYPTLTPGCSINCQEYLNLSDTEDFDNSNLSSSTDSD